MQCWVLAQFSAIPCEGFAHKHLNAQIGKDDDERGRGCGCGGCGVGFSEELGSSGISIRMGRPREVPYLTYAGRQGGRVDRAKTGVGKDETIHAQKRGKKDGRQRKC